MPLSASIILCIGVRQGGVASPILFIVYVDELYKRLEMSGIGIFIGSMYYGILGYADDLILLATTIYALNRMIKICQDFANEYCVQYNPTKSKFIVFNGDPINNEANVELDGLPLRRCDDIVFLGNTLTCDMNDALDIREKISDLNSRTNSLKYKLGNIDRDVKCKLFNAKCLHCYGSETWDLSSNVCNLFWSAAGQAARCLLGLPPCCPTTIVNTIFKRDVVKALVFRKSLGLIENLKQSTNEHVRFIYDNAMKDSRSIIRRNIDVICREWGGLTCPPFVPECSPTCAAICELLDVRDDLRHVPNMSEDDIDALMMLLCMRMH